MTKFSAGSERRSGIPGAGFLKKLLPWLTLALVFPTLILFNALFLTLFPAAGNGSERPTPDRALAQALDPGNYTVQSLFIYNSRNPDKLFGNFYYTLGTQLAARGQVGAAEPLLSKAVALLPDNPYPRMNYGIVLEALEKNEEAVAQYREAIKQDPKMVQAYYSLGLLYDKMGQMGQGIETLKKAVELAPENQVISYDLGVLYAKKGDFENSAIYSKKAVEGGSEFAEAYNNYGYALAQLGRHEEALVEIEKSLALKPDSAATLDSKGFALYGLGRYQDALQMYLDALKIDPTIGEIYLHLGQTYEKLKEGDKSIKAYDTYLQLTPDAPDRAEVESKIRQIKQWSQSKSK